MSHICCSPGRRDVVVAAFLVLTASTSVGGQGLGFEVQGYPAGGIFVARADFTPNWSLFGGANITDRRDFGEHLNEQGRGWGAGLGWRRGAPEGLDFGFRVDFWRLTIDWTDPNSGPLPNLPPGNRVFGTTKVTVAQPSVRLDYVWKLGEGGAQFRLGAALGIEKNVATTGEAVGQGPILLLGVAILFDLKR